MVKIMKEIFYDSETFELLNQSAMVSCSKIAVKIAPVFVEMLMHLKNILGPFPNN